MTLVIREMRDDDARSFLEVHHAAVRRIAVRDYPPEVIEAWAPLPITQVAMEAVVAIQKMRSASLRSATVILSVWLVL
jgi:putative acetyltransferase